MRKREYVAMGLIAIAIVSLAAAILQKVGFPIPYEAEGFSRLCSNVALITIALGIWFRKPMDA